MHLLTLFLLTAWVSESLTYPAYCGEQKTPPKIQSLIKPNLWKRMTEDKEVMTNAKLEKAPTGSDIQRYSFYVSSFVGGSISAVRQVLMDFKVYAQIIPYVSKAEYSAKDQVLLIEGGIWNFKLQSQIQFVEVSDRWIHYRIVGGHFKNLVGDIFFEPLGERGTVVYLNGEARGYHWPPQFIIERGAEIVFGFTAQRMRSYIESRKKDDIGGTNGLGQQKGLPQPRSRFQQQL